MEFSIGERLTLMLLLPREGDFLSLKLVRALREEVSESLGRDEESGVLTKEDGLYKWATEQDHLVEINLTPKATAIITEALEKLNKQKKLTENHISLYERFVDAD